MLELRLEGQKGRGAVGRLLQGPRSRILVLRREGQRGGHEKWMDSGHTRRWGLWGMRERREVQGDTHTPLPVHF